MIRIKTLCIALGLLVSGGCSTEVATLAQPEGASQEDWGKQLFFYHRCAVCHDLHGKRHDGPALNARFGTDVAFEGGDAGVFDRAYFRESVMEPEARLVATFKPQMPSYKGLIDEAQLAALEAFLRQPLPMGSE